MHSVTTFYLVFCCFLGGALKHISYEDLRKCILRCDTSVLTENLLQSLIQYIPAPDQLNRLKEFEKEYDSLAEAEQFAISISGIKRLVPRLKSLMFQQRYGRSGQGGSHTISHMIKDVGK